MPKKKLSLGDIVRKMNEEKVTTDPVVPESPAPAIHPVSSPPREREPESSAIISPELPAPEPGSDTGEALRGGSQDAGETLRALTTDQVVRQTSQKEQEVTGHTSSRNLHRSGSAENDAGRGSSDKTPYSHSGNQRIERLSSKSNDDEEESEFDLFRYLGIIIRRRYIVGIMVVLFTGISLFQYMRSDRFYTANARLLFKPDDRQIIDNQQFQRSSIDREKLFNTHLELLKSKTVLNMVADNLGGTVRPVIMQKKLVIRAGVTNKQSNDIIEISFANSDPMVSRDVLNELCRTYIDYRLDVNSQEVTRLLHKFEVQINKLQVELDLKESDLRRFKENNRMVQLSDETNLTVSKLSDMEIALQGTQLSLIESKERLLALQSQIGKQDLNIIQSMTFNDPTKDKIAELELEYNTLSAEYSAEHFKVKIIQQQIEKLKAAVIDSLTREAASRTMVKNPIRQSLVQDLVNLNVERSALEVKRVALEQIIEKLNTDLSRLPSMEQKYAFLQRETESILQTLKLLKNKYEEAKIRRDSQETDIKILELADLPQNAVGSVAASSIIIGLLIGLILGIALAFLFEYIDQSVKDPIDVEKGLDLPLLGIVPLIETNKALVQNSSDLAKTILEPFRALRANLKHLAQTYNCKVFMIASAVKGEGKTTLAANLAITFALDGKKVVLIDADLRRSQQHTLFAIPKEIGVSDYLLGTKDIDAILKKTVYENLSIITSGERPHNPAELVGTYRFDVLIKELRDRADFVLFDSPALLPVSDGITMAPKMDACVMVFRTMWTPLKAAKQAKYQLSRIGCNILGGIFNGVTHSRGYYPYYYGYYGYYSYTKYNYDDDHKKKLTLREIGIKIESGIKSRINALRYAFPRYLAGAAALGKTLARKRSLWVLIFILLGLVGAELWLNDRAVTEEIPSTTGISYLGVGGTSKESQALVRSQSPIRVIPDSTSQKESTRIESQSSTVRNDTADTSAVIQPQPILMRSGTKNAPDSTTVEQPAGLPKSTFQDTMVNQYNEPLKPDVDSGVDINSRDE